MAQVTVSINGKHFRMACEDGQEHHLMRLAQSFDQRIGELREKFGEIGDTRLTVMAALTIADELSETGARIRRLEEELAALQNARVVAADRAKETEAALVAAFNAASERIETMAKELNQSIGNGAIGMG
jgi:cell division protein ZapA